jgi:hypothetical protein
MLNSIFGLLKDTVDIADSIISVPVTIVRGVTKPIAEVAKDIKKEVEDLIDD